MLNSKCEDLADTAFKSTLQKSLLEGIINEEQVSKISTILASEFKKVFLPELKATSFDELFNDADSQGEGVFWGFVPTPWTFFEFVIIAGVIAFIVLQTYNAYESKLFRKEISSLLRKLCFGCIGSCCVLYALFGQWFDYVGCFLSALSIISGTLSWAVKHFDRYNPPEKNMLHVMLKEHQAYSLKELQQSTIFASSCFCFVWSSVLRYIFGYDILSLFSGVSFLIIIVESLPMLFFNANLPIPTPSIIVFGFSIVALIACHFDAHDNFLLESFGFFTLYLSLENCDRENPLQKLMNGLIYISFMIYDSCHGNICSRILGVVGLLTVNFRSQTHFKWLLVRQSLSIILLACASLYTVRSMELFLGITMMIKNIWCPMVPDLSNLNLVFLFCDCLCSLGLCFISSEFMGKNAVPFPFFVLVDAGLLISILASLNFVKIYYIILVDHIVQSKKKGMSANRNLFMSIALFCWTSFLIFLATILHSYMLGLVSIVGFSLTIISITDSYYNYYDKQKFENVNKRELVSWGLALLFVELGRFMELYVIMYVGIVLSIIFMLPHVSKSYAWIVAVITMVWAILVNSAVLFLLSAIFLTFSAPNIISLLCSIFSLVFYIFFPNSILNIRRLLLSVFVGGVFESKLNDCNGDILDGTLYSNLLFSKPSSIVFGIPVFVFDQAKNNNTITEAFYYILASIFLLVVVIGLFFFIKTMDSFRKSHNSIDGYTQREGTAVVLTSVCIEHTPTSLRVKVQGTKPLLMSINEGRVRVLGTPALLAEWKRIVPENVLSVEQPLKLNNFFDFEKEAGFFFRPTFSMTFELKYDEGVGLTKAAIVEGLTTLSSNLSESNHQEKLAILFQYASGNKLWNLYHNLFSAQFDIATTLKLIKNKKGGTLYYHSS